jgi:chemotaxis protein CheX
MIDLSVVSGKPSLKKEKRPTTEVIGLISMAGPVSGFICLGLSKKLAFYLSSKLLECQITENTADCIDAIGEIINMIAGNAKSDFPDDGISISVPKVIFDSANETYPITAPVISIPFETKGEAFFVDMALNWKSKRI